MDGFHERSPFKRLNPSQIERGGWPLEKTAFRILQLVLLVCPFWWVIDSTELCELDELFGRNPAPPMLASTLRAEAIKAKFDLWRARWVVGSSFLLALFWLINPSDPVATTAFGIVAVVRLVEILTTGLGTTLEQEQQIRARNLVTIAAYAVQATLIFAILYHSFASGDFVLESGTHATHALDYLNVSWSNFTSLGSTYVPSSGVARFLAVSTTTTGIILLGVLLAFGIDALEKREDSETKLS